MKKMTDVPDTDEQNTTHTMHLYNIDNFIHDMLFFVYIIQQVFLYDIFLKPLRDTRSHSSSSVLEAN